MTMEGYVIMMNCMTRRVKVTRKDGENTIDKTGGLLVLKIKLRKVYRANNYKCCKKRKAEPAICKWNFYVQH